MKNKIKVCIIKGYYAGERSEKMRKNFGVQTWLFPQPVMIIGTYDKEGNPNAMNAAWGGICGRDEIIVDLGDHKTTENLKANKYFTVGVADAGHVVECDYVGVVSGRNVPDKVKKAGFTVTKGEYVNAPVINELPITLECELIDIIGHKYLGKIINVSADESILGEDGKPDLSKFSPITFEPVHHKYVALGETVGNAFSDGNKISEE